MKINHIYHSGFLVSLDHSCLLFDWYTGDLPDIPADKKLYVFCSHSHADHYSPRIWDLQLSHPEVIYILDEGIGDARNHPEARILQVRPRMYYEIAGRIIRHWSPEEMRENGGPEIDLDSSSEEEEYFPIRFWTLESTDMGVAFFVETEGRRIYHAGDLNVWFWNDEPMEDNLASEKKCREEMQFLADALNGEADPLRGGINDKDGEPLIHAAFVPLDPRLEEYAPKCVEAFMEILGARFVFPMHYWGELEKTKAYLRDEKLLKYADRIYFDDEMVIF